MLKLLVLYFVVTTTTAQLFGDNFKLDPASAKEFQERNGLPEDPNSVYPAQALLPPSYLENGPSNRVTIPIKEEENEGGFYYQQQRPQSVSPFGLNSFYTSNGLNSLVFG